MLGTKNNFNGFKISNDKCRFTGNLNTPLGNINYNAICSVYNNTLELDVNTAQGSFKLTGKRI